MTCLHALNDHKQTYFISHSVQNLDTRQNKVSPDVRRVLSVCQKFTKRSKKIVLHVEEEALRTSKKI